MKQSAKFFLFVFVAFFCVDLMAEDKAKELETCISEYYDDGLTTKEEISAAKNPIDIAFAKNCRPTTCNNDSKNSVDRYLQAWKEEFEFAVKIITGSLKNKEDKKEFERFESYVKQIETFNNYDVMGSHLVFGGELNGGSSANGIVSMTWATLYRMSTLFLIKQHLDDYKYKFSGADLNKEIKRRNDMLNGKIPYPKGL